MPHPARGGHQDRFQGYGLTLLEGDHGLHLIDHAATLCRSQDTRRFRVAGRSTGPVPKSRLRLCRTSRQRLRLTALPGVPDEAVIRLVDYKTGHWMTGLGSYDRETRQERKAD